MRSPVGICQIERLSQAETNHWPSRVKARPEMPRLEGSGPLRRSVSAIRSTFEGEIARVEGDGVGSGDDTETGPPIGVGLTGGSAVGVDDRAGGRVGVRVAGAEEGGGWLAERAQAMTAQRLTAITARVRNVLRTGGFDCIIPLRSERLDSMPSTGILWATILSQKSSPTRRAARSAAP